MPRNSIQQNIYAFQMHSQNKERLLQSFIHADKTIPELDLSEKKEYLYANYNVGKLAYKIFELTSCPETADMDTARDYLIIALRCGYEKAIELMCKIRPDVVRRPTETAFSYDLAPIQNAIAALLKHDLNTYFYFLDIAAKDNNPDVQALLGLIHYKTAIKTQNPALKAFAMDLLRNAHQPYTHTILATEFKMLAGLELKSELANESNKYYDLAASFTEPRALINRLKHNPTPFSAQEYVELLTMQESYVTSDLLAGLIENRIDYTFCAFQHRLSFASGEDIFPQKIPTHKPTQNLSELNLKRSRYHSPTILENYTSQIQKHIDYSKYHRLVLSKNLFQLDVDSIDYLTQDLTQSHFNPAMVQLVINAIEVLQTRCDTLEMGDYCDLELIREYKERINLFYMSLCASLYTITHRNPTIPLLHPDFIPLLNQINLHFLPSLNADIAEQMLEMLVEHNDFINQEEDVLHSTEYLELLTYWCTHTAENHITIRNLELCKKILCILSCNHYIIDDSINTLAPTHENLLTVIKAGIKTRSASIAISTSESFALTDIESMSSATNPTPSSTSTLPFGFFTMMSSPGQREDAHTLFSIAASPSLQMMNFSSEN